MSRSVTAQHMSIISPSTAHRTAVCVCASQCTSLIAAYIRLQRYLELLKHGSPLCPPSDATTFLTSGAGTNLKVGLAHFLVVARHFFGFTSTISRFCERFRDGQYSLVSFLFAVLLIHGAPVPNDL